MTALGALLSNQGIPRSGLSLANKHMWSNTTALAGHTINPGTGWAYLNGSPYVDFTPVADADGLFRMFFVGSFSAYALNGSARIYIGARAWNQSNGASYHVEMGRTYSVQVASHQPCFGATVMQLPAGFLYRFELCWACEYNQIQTDSNDYGNLIIFQ